MAILCSVEGCRREAHSKGLCSTHYAREWRTHHAGAATSTEAPIRRRREIPAEIVQAAVAPDTAQTIREQAAESKISIAQLAGEVLDRWAKKKKR